MQNLRAACAGIRFKPSVQAVLSYDGACLHIDFPGSGLVVPVQGSWPGQIRVSANWFHMMLKMPPSSDPIVFQVEDGRLNVEGVSINCVVQESWQASIQLPVNAPPGMLIALSMRCTPEEIEASGLTARVNKAREEFERKIETASKSLKLYGLFPEKLRELLLTCIKSDPSLNRF